VGARLRGDLARLQPLNPFQVLDLGLDADHEAVRRAFIALTKRYHPARFARESPETVDVANELFLIIHKSYAQLSDNRRRRAWRERIAAAAGTAHVRRPTPMPMPLAPPAEPMRAQATSPSVRPRAAPAPPSPSPPVAPAALVSPTTGRTTEQVRVLLDEARTRGQRFDLAARHVAQGRYAQARELLIKLCAEDPPSRRFRHKLHLASGLEHRDAGRSGEAVRELERAVALEAEPSEATEALKKLQADRKGLFGKLFGR